MGLVHYILNEVGLLVFFSLERERLDGDKVMRGGRENGGYIPTSRVPM